MPLFSVTIPAFKPTFLQETIESVLAQTYTDFELIIVNDASPYDIDSVVKPFLGDSRLRYFTNEHNCGARRVVDNWNICLSHACGQYVCCIGDDDTLTPSYLADFAQLIARYPQVDLLHARSVIIDEHSQIIQELELRPEWESVWSLMWNPRNTHLGDFMFKTSTLRANGGYYNLPYGWAADDLSAFTAAASHGVCNTQRVGFCYRGNGESISHDMSCIEDKIRAYQHWGEWVQRFCQQQPDNAEDRRYRDLIAANREDYVAGHIDDMVEWDMRKQPCRRSLFWLFNHARFGITWHRYLRSYLRAMKHILRAQAARLRFPGSSC